MKLLVGNDDGVFAPGIRALANTLAEAGHEVIVVCPDRERSATGHGLTIHQPIRAEEVDAVFHESVRAWACSGTPSDCIKLALGALLETPPDLVLSGINQGANLGTDVLYSGTVSAAMEGVIEGIPSIAFSLTSFAYHDFGPSAQFALKMVSRLQQHPIESPILFNVNIPAVPERDIQGVAFTRQGIRRYFDMFEKRIDPRGKTYYWLAGEVLEDAEMPPGFQEMADIQTDVQANRHKQISITPLQYNLTLNQGFHDLEQWLKF